MNGFCNVPLTLFIILFNFTSASCQVGCADFSALRSKMPSEGFQSDDGTSVMGMCGDLPAVCNSKDGFLAVFDDNHRARCDAVFARWEPKQKVEVGEFSVSILFENGDDCAQGKWFVNATFVCNPSVEYEPFEINVNFMGCQVFSTMQTKYACHPCSNLPPDDLVKSLPEFGSFAETQYAGFLPVDDRSQNSYNGSLFYWFIASSLDSDASKASTPLIIWLNGGPGASSMMGAFAENGPYSIDEDGTFTINRLAWTKVGHMLYIDNPVGTGYSYVESGGYATNEVEVSVQFRYALSKFFEKHPSLQQNKLYIAGESYGGKYNPHIAYEISQWNSNQTNSSKIINLKGILIGNGLYDPLNQFKVLPNYYENLGMVSDETRDLVTSKYTQPCIASYNEGDYISAWNYCSAGSDMMNHEAGDIFEYDIRQKDDSSFQKISQNLNQYLNRDDVMKALNTEGHKWTPSGGAGSLNPVSLALASDVMKNNTIDLFEKIMDNDIKIMLYVGNMDSSVCGVVGHNQLVKNFNWSGRDEFWSNPRSTWYTSDGNVGGYIRSSKIFSYNIIHNSGHLVPRDQPLASLEMVYRFVYEGL